jgi:hypothetical protein
VHSVTKAQLALETATAGKVAAVAASAAAAAGGGLATVERTGDRERGRQDRAAVVQKSAKRAVVRSASMPAVAASPPAVPESSPASAAGAQADQGPPGADSAAAEHASSAEFDLEVQAQSATAVVDDLTPARSSDSTEPSKPAPAHDAGSAAAAHAEFGP